ncbi:MAG: hypothetical protein WBE74_26015 [Terracidiphilus sp.]
MTLSDASQKAIDDYLAALRRQLRDLMEEDMNDIVEEIRAHILDKTTAGADPAQVEQTLAALGAPAALAERYRTDELLKRAQLSPSPMQVLHRILRAALVSVTALIVFVVSGLGYCVGGVLVVIGLLKAFFPRQAGLNIDYVPNHSFSAGFGAGSPHNADHDPIGLWLIPISLLLGAGILFLTFRLGTWTMRKFRRSRTRQFA